MASGDNSAPEDENVSSSGFANEVSVIIKCKNCGNNIPRCTCNGINFVSNGTRNGFGKGMFVNKQSISFT